MPSTTLSRLRVEKQGRSKVIMRYSFDLSDVLTFIQKARPHERRAIELMLKNQKF